MRKIALYLAILIHSAHGYLNATAQDLYDETTLRTFELSFTQSNWWQQLVDNKEEEIYIPADLKVDGNFYANVGVRFKGSSSYWGSGNSQKKPFKIKMDEFVPGQELYGYETINLNNSFRDPSFIREVLGYRIIRDYMPTPKANFAKLMINNENWGVYINVQQINKDFLREWFVDEDGNRYKANVAHSGRSALTWLGDDPDEYASAYELLTENNPNLWVDIRQVCEKLNLFPASAYEAELNPIFNIDRALWMIALDDVLPNLDSYLGTGWNYLLYQDDYHGRMQVLPWDVNECIGGYRNGLTIQQTWNLSPFYLSGNSNFPLMQRLAASDFYRPWYLAHLRTIVTESFSWSLLEPVAIQYRDLIRTEVYADTKKLYTNQAFEDNLTQDVVIQTWPSGTWLVSAIQPMIENRQANLMNHPEVSRTPPLVENVQHSPASPNDSDTVWVTADLANSPVMVASVKLRWRVRGIFQEIDMHDDGLHQDGMADDGVYGSSIPPQAAASTVQYVILAKATGTSGGAWVFSPSEAEHLPYSYEVEAQSFIRINEFMAKNESTIQDEAGDYDDWLELYNSTNQVVDLGGSYLTDDLKDLTQWQIPAGTWIPAFGTVLIWADDEPGSGPLHANFKLSANGETLALVDPDGSTIRDVITFGAQQADIATGRFFDGQKPWVSFKSSTPNASNEQSNCGFRNYAPLDPTEPVLSLSGNGTPSATGTIQMSVSGAAPFEDVLLVGSWSSAYVESSTLNGTLLIDVQQIVESRTVSADATGTATWIRQFAQPGLSGRVVYLQAHAPGSNSLSDGLEMIFCP